MLHDLYNHVMDGDLMMLYPPVPLLIKAGLELMRFVTVYDRLSYQFPNLSE